MIKFGTDGWRGLIAKDFTFDNVHLVALATARYIRKNFEGNHAAVIGYDARFLSRQFAEATAQVMAWQGITVHLTDDISTTPQVSYHTKQKGVNLGVVITASHNPSEYNGFKLKADFGGPATPDQVAMVEAELKKIVRRPPQFKFKPLDYYIENKKIRLFDAKQSYIRHLRKKIDTKLIKAADFKVLYDPMHGAGMYTLCDILPDADEIHNDFNPGFGEIDHPEPIKECLPQMAELMESGKYDIGLATDGDADRLGAFDNEGNFVDSHKIFMILMKYLSKTKKKKGAVVKTVSLTSMVNKFCEANNIKLYETPVGFKYTAEIMSQEPVLIGGEESGGLGTSLHIPERDGLFNGLLLMEVMAQEKKSLKELCDDLDIEYGPHRYQRRDVRVTPQLKKAIMNACAKRPKTVGRFDVVEINDRDGYKFIFDNAWLLIRASGTEPLLRFYAEADTITMVNELLDEGMKISKK